MESRKPPRHGQAQRRDLESYLYDDSGMRVKKSTAGVDSYYVNPLYEVSGGVVTKYYYFGGQRVAMRKNGALTYLHTDHLGSTVLETVNGTPTANQTYHAYGRQRDSGPVSTDHRFTGQKYDGTGLIYYQSRYYDSALGAFISPDTLVPDASLVSDYNRYLMVRGNPLRNVDPNGHDPIDTTWQAEFEQAHHRAPTAEDILRGRRKFTHQGHRDTVWGPVKPARAT